MRFKSFAQWPPGTISGGNDTSDDTHDTREQAEAVCQLLRRNGFGGCGQVFPVRTWTEPAWREAIFDYDARRRPRTKRCCTKCQRDILEGSPVRWIHIVSGGATVLHPEDEQRYQSDGGDMGFFEVGMECARIIGLEWTHDKPK